MWRDNNTFDMYEMTENPCVDSLILPGVTMKTLNEPFIVAFSFVK